MSPLLRISLTALMLAALSTVHASSNEFIGMPGLWMTTTHRFHNNKEISPPVVAWHCVVERADPWISFAKHPVPGHEAQQCDRSAQEHSNASLAWKQTCPGVTAVQGTGQIDFDSATDYTGRFILDGGTDRIEVQGIRRAACTSPMD